jgi:hypothetical protein
MLALVIPVVGVLVWSMAPLIRGAETLYMRDVFNTHLEKKFYQSEAMKDGRLPLIDPLRDGGQPHLGNPNAVALYPDNALFLVSPFFWAFNAHFWLHLLIAPFTFYWMCRAWGLKQEPSWIAGACYASSGFFLSTMNLYNLVGVVTWTPALVASFLCLPNAGKRGRSVAIAALIWTLILLAGDPMTSLTALGLAVLALLVRDGFRGIPWRPTIAALVLGSLVAAPQIVEFLRILPLSFRGHQGFSAEAATAASWNPITVADWFIPFVFGKPDLTFWGQRFFGGDPPLFPSLYPGILALLLVASSGRVRGASARWAWLMMGAGIFLSLGAYNPIVGWMLALPGMDLLRLPIKFWLLVAVGASLLCGLGYQRLVAGASRRALVLCWSVLLIGYATAWIVLTFWPQLVPASLQPGSSASNQLAEFERLRWAGLCFLSLVGLILYAAIWGVGRKLALSFGPLLVTVHVASQMFILQPMLPMDQVAAYTTPPEALVAIPQDAIVTHGKSNSLFGKVQVPVDRYPDPSLRWLERQIFEEVYPVAGNLAARRYDFSISAEGLDAFLTRATAQSLMMLSDLGRIRLLAASGVNRLLVDRELDPEVGDEAELEFRWNSIGGEMLAYRLPRAIGEATFVGQVKRAPHLNAALSWITSDDFDPSRMAVLPEGGEPLNGPAGKVEVVASDAESITLQVEAESAGVLVVQRAFLPLYRARANGEVVPITAANMHRLGIELPPGRHDVEIWVDRRPLRIASFGSLVGLALIGWIAWRYEG